MFVLDVGFIKICCLIVKFMLQDEKVILFGCFYKVDVFGYGYQRFCGIKFGVVVDMDVVEQVIWMVVDSVECMVGVIVELLIVNIFCGCL